MTRDEGNGEGSGSSERPAGASDGRLAAASDRLVGRLKPFAPLVVLAAVLSAAGWLVGRTGGLPAAVDGSRVFFQVVLAGAAIAVLRNEVGLRTYGLFAPAIIAFIMLGSGPIWGLLLFVNVLVVTLVGYRALRPLKLGTAPRVAVLLSVAGIVTSLAFVAADRGHLPTLTGAEQVFFPTIVSAWYADRAASEVEERGWRAPARRLLATLVAVGLAYAVIANEPLVDWFVATPAAWGATLLAVAYLGSRPGFRLSEYRRFDGHFTGDLGPLSVAATRLRLRAATVRWSLVRLAGGDPDDPAVTESDVLSMKRRNRYIDAYNPPHVRPAADEKAAVNRRLAGLGIDAPQTYAVIDRPGDLDAVDRVIDERDAFVIKPSKGFGGEGIVVVSGRCDDAGTDFDAEADGRVDTDGSGDEGRGDAVYATSGGQTTARELRDHVRRIVDGQYSGLDTEGTAILEEKLTPAAFVRDLHGEGVADVRVIVFQGFPVMAMTRLPTVESGGAANLHLGAVGVGLSVADGTPLRAYQQSRDRELAAHPDTGASLTDFRVPNWERVLETAVRAAAASGLGYTGVDVVLAEGNVPKVLEVNVRPGLGIQNTTGQGLFGRLEFVESLPSEYEFLPPERKLELAREWDAANYAPEALPADDEPFDGTGATGRTDTDDGPTVEQPVVTDGSGLEGPPGETPASADDGAETDVDRLWFDRRRRTIGGSLASLLLLAGAWWGGVPVFTLLFVLVPVGFVAGLCAKAVGLGGARW
jgi:alpha-L-glutamate ligase-like protein